MLAQCISGVAAFNSGLWNIPTPVRPGSGQPGSTDARQDRCIVQAAVAARTASGHMLHQLCHQGPLGNLLAAGFRSHVPLARLPIIPKSHAN